MEYSTRKPNRLVNWNYASARCYHVIFCTKNRQCLLSHVSIQGFTASSELTPIGKACLKAIEEAEAYYPGVSIACHAIMPNHVHALIRLDDESVTLGTVVGRIKSRATAYARKMIPSIELWQRGYYDHIIRGDQDFKTTWEYIEANPAKWAEDEYYA